MVTRIIIFCVVAVLFFSLLTVTVCAEDNNVFQIKINGNDFIIPEGMGYPYFKDDRTMVPLRAFVEALGYQVNWDNGTIYIPINNSSVVLKIGEKVISTPKGSIIMDTVAETNPRDGRTYIPLRFVGESLEYKVSYKNLGTLAESGITNHLITVYKDGVDAGTTSSTTRVSKIEDASFDLTKDKEFNKVFNQYLKNNKYNKCSRYSFDYSNGSEWEKAYGYIDVESKQCYISNRRWDDDNKAITRAFMCATLENSTVEEIYTEYNRLAEEFFNSNNRTKDWIAKNGIASFAHKAISKKAGNIEYMFRLDSSGLCLIFK